MIKMIADDFVLPGFDVSSLDDIPVAYKKQGSPVSAVYDGLHWLTYSVFDDGRISFTRNTQKYLPEVVEYTAQFLEKRFPNLPVYRERIHFLQTKGKIREHRDEAGRRTSINIGIKNTSTAVTRFGVEDKYETFNTNYEDFTCQDGKVYLLNTSVLHSVLSQTEDVRTLITMTIVDDYRTALKQIIG